MAFPKKMKAAKKFESSAADEKADRGMMKGVKTPMMKKGGFVPFKKKGKKK